MLQGLGNSGVSGAWLAPRPVLRSGPASADGGTAFSVSTDTSGVKDGVDKQKAGNLATGQAAGSAREELDMLAGLAKSVGGSGDHKPIAAFTMDRNGNILSQASLDANGNLTVYGSGAAQGATSEVSMYLPSDGASNGDWYKQVSTEMALASYNLNSLLGGPESKAQGTRISATA